jgi:hypothetical protein
MRHLVRDATADLHLGVHKIANWGAVRCRGRFGPPPFCLPFPLSLSLERNAGTAQVADHDRNSSKQLIHETPWERQLPKGFSRIPSRGSFRSVSESVLRSPASFAMMPRLALFGAVALTIGCGGSTETAADAGGGSTRIDGRATDSSESDGPSESDAAAEAGVECGDAACRQGQYCVYEIGGGPGGAPTSPPTPVACVDVHTSWCDASQCQCLLPDPCPAGAGTCQMVQSASIFCGGQ